MGGVRRAHTPGSALFEPAAAAVRGETVRTSAAGVWIALGRGSGRSASIYIGQWFRHSAGSRRLVVRARRRNPDGDIPVLDLICVVGIIALGAIVALVGRGVEKL